ncbi:CaiB/BaiF CoA transferase family protein, partial [Candidatus Entotheonella palauensis]|uniref:CaiB/BaiF CoA transferase family protein n=1 Tax=Candidatus Entotheonella palauensis TaxID=93172 RepID=UPI000B7CC256
ASRIAGPYCGKILAHMGAEVIKVEPPDGDEARHLGPFPNHIPHPEKSGLFLWLNANKYGVTLDTALPHDRRRLATLIRTADILIESDAQGSLHTWQPEGISSRQSLRQRHPGLILTSVTPFGSWGPYADYKATDLVLFHMSGNAHGLLGPVEEPDRDPPIRAGGHQAELVAGMAAATATLSALYRKRMTDLGCHVELSAFEAMANQLISGLANCAYGQPAPPRAQHEVKEAAIGGMVTAIGGVLPCRDGYVAISPREDAQWARWLDVMGQPAWADDVRFRTREARQQHTTELWELLSQWSRQYSKHDIAQWGQDQRIPCFPANTVEDLLSDEHLAARQFFVNLDHPVAGSLKYPGVPYTFSNTPLPLNARPAPLLGQHNDVLLGTSAFLPQDTPFSDSTPQAVPRPLNGVRVVDLSWIIAGPTATRFLAMMGAEVIKVGSARRPDPSTRGAPFQAYNQSKRYAALNLSQPEGLELAKQLLRISDVVVENFAAGVIERLGLGYDVVSSVKPDIIMVSSSGTGHSGPHKDYVAYGSLLQHYTGWNGISGYPNREPIKGGLWADPWVGMELAMATLAALNHRATAGEGQYIDLSMAEALSASIPEALLDYQMNGEIPSPQGNRDDWDAPHGVYPCAGTDRWIAIAVTSETEWQALCGVIERPDLAADSGLLSAEGRRWRRDELDAAIALWTRHQDDESAMHRLQAAGVPAGPSLDIARVYQSSQLREGGYLTPLRTSDGETRELPGLPWRFTDLDDHYITAAPVLGQDNTYVYRELLGLSEAEIARLVDAQIIY